MKRFLLLFFVWCSPAWSALIEYELEISYQWLNYSGEPARAMVLNNSYPGPVLRFREGDVARIAVTNSLDVDTSVHWHGLLLPSDQDGVPYMSSLPIAPGETFVYEFPLSHAGTYWYHSHTDLQEQSGVHGAIVVEPRSEHLAYQHEAVLILQDWTDEDPHQVLANLKKDGDYYAMRKDSVISIAGFLERGAIGNWWMNRWIRMGGMDIADVAYDAFLINGKSTQRLFSDAFPGDKARLRIVNAGASTYFQLHSAGLNFQVVAADGLDVHPVRAEQILHAAAETYDLIVEIPSDGARELRASAQDGSGYASVLIGPGEPIYAAALPKPDLYMSHAEHQSDSSSRDHHHHHHHHGHHGPKQLAYADLRNLDPLKYAGGEEYREIELRLTGDMETYNWSFNNIPLSRADRIMVSRGEAVRFKFVNETMMHHPLHLHGHFFRVLDEQGNGPFKHTVNVPPLETVTIEFLANEKNDWFFHCHNLYHAKTGMARVIRYDDYGGNAAFNRARMASTDIKDKDFYGAGAVEFLSDFQRIGLWTANHRHRFEIEGEWRNQEELRGEWTYLFRTSRWSQWLAGVEQEGGDEAEWKLGLRYVLPMLIDMDVFITDDQDVVAEFETELQLTKHMQMHLEYETTGRYHHTLEYRLDESVSVEAAYTSEVDFSAGVKIRF